jgi:hypothetical protein
MVDFKKLREAKAKPKPLNPRDIFNALPKPPGINDLYASQAEVLDAWYARRTDKDVVVKLHTGGGKTLVALLMAQSVMNERGSPSFTLPRPINSSSRCSPRARSTASRPCLMSRSNRSRPSFMTA